MVPKAKIQNPKEFFDSLEEPRKSDIMALDLLIRKVAPELKRFMINGMLGYGAYHYTYATGREGDWAVIGLASQKNYISLYTCMVDEKGYVAERYASLLPKANIGKSCVRIKKLTDIDLKQLEKLIKENAKIAQRMNYRYDATKKKA